MGSEGANPARTPASLEGPALDGLDSTPASGDLNSKVAGAHAGADLDPLLGEMLAHPGSQDGRRSKDDGLARDLEAPGADSCNKRISGTNAGAERLLSSCARCSLGHIVYVHCHSH